MKFPYYSGNIKISNALGLVSLDYFLEAHKNPTDLTRKLIHEIQIASKNKDKEKKSRLKQQLHSFTPSVIIDKGEKRQYANIKSFTGLMQIDLDGINDEQKALDLKEHIFYSHPEIITAYLSPSKNVKALMLIKIPEDIEHYKSLHRAVEVEFEQYGYFDHATSNAILPLFLSYDENILIRDKKDWKRWTIENWEQPDYVSLNSEPNPTPLNTAQEKYYYDKVVRIIEKRINDIVDNGHPQVRNTALVLGSRVAAGYLTRYDAEALMERLIVSNDYLQKGISGYVKTAVWGITQGMKIPKYF